MDLDRGDLLWLVGLIALGCLTLSATALHAYRFTTAEGGVPLDDAWIHFQFARNLARGDGFAFNPGQPTAGSTAPLWTLLLAGIYALGGRFPSAGQALSAVSFLTTLLVTYALGKRLTGRRWVAWLAGAVVAVNGRMVWAGLSALEICLFATLSMLAINAHLTDRKRARYRLHTAALFGLAALARPEGYLLFALALADFALSVLQLAPPDRHKALHVLRRLLLPALLFAVIVVPYLIFSLHTSGHLLPNTFHAKATFNGLPDRDFLSLWARYLVLDNPLLLPFYLLGAMVLPFQGPGTSEERATLLSIWSLGLPIGYAFLHAVLYQHGRYLMPLIPCNAVIASAGLLMARPFLRRRGWRWSESEVTLVVIVTLLAVAGTAWRLPTMARLYAWNVHNINQMHVALGRWAAENTPTEAALALNDIGAITYFSRRPVVDLAGLITPEIVPVLRRPDRAPQLVDFLVQREVEYVIIFPNWFPRLAAHEALTPIHQVTLERRTIGGGETMVVYRLAP